MQLLTCFNRLLVLGRLGWMLVTQPPMVAGQNPGANFNMVANMAAKLGRPADSNGLFN
jgi:hypothetical protein